MPIRKKPPDGVMPRALWDEAVRSFSPPMSPRDANAIRVQSLFDAVFRYRAAGLEPRPEWSEELEMYMRCYLIVDRPDSGGSRI